jgi:hypothetical protein
MRKGLFFSLPFWMLLCIVFPVAALATAPLDRWHTLVADGASNESKGEHETAIGSFALAAAEAEKSKLPVKFLEIALCRQTEVEILANRVAKAEPHYERLVSLVKADKLSGSLDPEVGVWLVDLADTYQARLNPKIREDCLKHACQLKSMTFGGAHHECTDCLMQLARYYFEHDRLDNGVKTLETILSVKSKTIGNDPSALGNMLNFLAIGYKNQHRYDLAEQLESFVIKMTSENTPTLQAGLPAFYLLLGMNSLSQNKNVKAKESFAIAVKECSRIKGTQQKEIAKSYLSLLIQPAQTDMDDHKLAVSETDFKQLLAVQRRLFKDPREQYGPLTFLGHILDGEHKYSEGEACTKQAIAIARLPNSCVEKDLPELYMRLATYQSFHRTLEESNKTYADALRSEKDPTGFHATYVLFWWGWSLKEHKLFPQSIEKLNLAVKNAHALPPEKRGTLLADSLAILSTDQAQTGNLDQAKRTTQDSIIEIEVQRKLNTKLGPDFFHRLPTK